MGLALSRHLLDRPGLRVPVLRDASRARSLRYPGIGAARRLAAGLFLCLACGSALAWGEEGHRIAADIAARLLSPRAAAAVAQLLREDRFADGRPSGRRTLAAVASWADEIKAYSWGRATGPWHYDNAPLCRQRGRAAWCGDGNCASAQIERQLLILRDRRASLSQRNEALKWIVHLVADIHQPLHAADRDDEGGNRIEVSLADERVRVLPLRLHSIWDTQLLRRLIERSGGEARIAAAPIAPQQQAEWERGGIEAWLADSHALARDVVYGSLPVPHACGTQIAGVVNLDERYYARAAPAIELQLRKAGVRIAKILNDALGG